MSYVGLSNSQQYLVLAGKMFLEIYSWYQYMFRGICTVNGNVGRLKKMNKWTELRIAVLIAEQR